MYLLGRGEGTYVDNQSLHHTKYTPYKVVYSWLLYKLSGGTGMFGWLPVVCLLQTLTCCNFSNNLAIKIVLYNILLFECVQELYPNPISLSKLTSIHIQKFNQRLQTSMKVDSLPGTRFWLSTVLSVLTSWTQCFHGYLFLLEAIAKTSGTEALQRVFFNKLKLWSKGICELNAWYSGETVTQT